ncbi:MAG TPA: ATP-binding protein, partial [Elusimicrobiota bacterium]|nr:ATP-binding protein [Elusimicrobiota bacterium]
SDGPCPILASRVHLQRLFLNLFLNALSVSKEGSVVRLATRREAEFAVAAVEDEGPGFSAEILPRLFGAYETTRASSGGTGLGLNLCARIAREHGGALSAENRPEGGARLVLRLPLASGDQRR